METDLEPSPVTADGIANQLLSSCLLLVSEAPKEKKIGATPQYSLEDESGRLKIWAHGFDAINGHLDEVLEYSKYLREPTVLLLVNLASCLLGIFKEAKDKHTRSLLEQAIQDAINIYPQIDNICYDSGSEGSQGSVVEELHDIVDSLYQLAPALNDVLEKLQAPANLKLPPITDFYRGLILDKFPNARPYLVLRLAEGNKRCHERLRPQTEKQKAPMDDVMDRETPTVGIESHAPTTSFYDSGIGISQPSLHPPPSISAFSEFTTFSVLKDRPPLPRIPENAGSKSGFKCPICACHQRPLHDSRQWRKHIYSDIEPYICSYEDCTHEQKSFGSTREWINHQKSHELLDSNESRSTCPFCFKEFMSSPEKLYHHISHHMEDIRILTLPPSNRLEDNFLDEDNSSGTGASEEILPNIGQTPTSKKPSRGASNYFERHLRTQGTFNKIKLVEDWIPNPDFSSDKQNEDVVMAEEIEDIVMIDEDEDVVMIEGVEAVSKANYPERPSKQIPTLSDTQINTSEDDTLVYGQQRTILRLASRPRSSGPFSCAECPMKFKFLSKFREHERRHLPPSCRCHTCGELFTQDRTLKKHIRRKHPNEDALKLYEWALVEREKALGKDHPDTLGTVHRIASVHNQQGRHEEALEWYIRALVGRKKTLGPEHPDTLTTATRMATVPGGGEKLKELGYNVSVAPSGDESIRFLVKGEERDINDTSNNLGQP